MLKYELPMKYNGGSYLMNQRTLALLLTMSDGMGWPLLQALPQGQPAFTLAGSPTYIASQMPDCGPGSTPVAYGDWKQTYMIVDRKAVTMLVDPYSAGFCTVFKFEARCGGATAPTLHGCSESEKRAGPNHTMSMSELSLFDEMDRIADAVGQRGDAEMLRGGTLKVEFRRLQKVRQRGIDGAEFDDLFQLWLERRTGQMQLRMAAGNARLNALQKEQDELFARREPVPAGPERDALSARIMATSLDIMALIAPGQKPPGAVAR